MLNLLHEIAARRHALFRRVNSDLALELLEVS